MTEWSVTHEHHPDNITLLCKQHHGEKTVGLLPVEAVREANSNPFNLRTGSTSPYMLHFSGTTATAMLGSNEFTSIGESFSAVIVDGVPLVHFRIEDGACLLTVQLFDEHNHPVLTIDENELVYSTNSRDVEFVGSTLTIRAGAGDIFLVLKFVPPGRLEIIRGRLLLNGVRIMVEDGAAVIGQSMVMVGSRAVQCSVGLNVGFDPYGIPSGYQVIHVNRYQPLK